MKDAWRWRAGYRHPLCTCPETRLWEPTVIDRDACRGGSIAHPIIDRDTLDELVRRWLDHPSD